MSKAIKIGVGYGDDITFFHLRHISMSEESKFTSKFNFGDLPAEERAEKEHETLVDAIASWSTQGPTKKAVKEGKSIDELIYPEMPSADAVRKFFSDTEYDAERLVNSLMLTYRSRLQPSVVF